MGLHMYLRRRQKKNTLEVFDEDTQFQNTVYDWAKAYQLHYWLIENCERGNYDHEPFVVTKENFDKVIEEMEKALTPDNGGYFDTNAWFIPETLELFKQLDHDNYEYVYSAN